MKCPNCDGEDVTEDRPDWWVCKKCSYIRFVEPAESVPVPKSRRHAECMILIAESYLKGIKE